ncbi:DMT family transporter [Hyphomicrobium sp. CS1BSMeth3]|uniref:DMT family transporter n=1 Tax=Hyphomicrobium sp. CS1BSMeth3 TaxID=1892844 RepID=UPI000931D2D4|nr:DMT family transporter [Hyphomicrobium sp. CS1BSMeth3]
MSTFPHAAIVYALASAFLFALTNHFQSLGLMGSDARTGSLINIATGAVFYWLLAPFVAESWYWFTWGTVLFAMVGIIRPSLSSLLAIQSIHVMGPTLTSALTASAPIFGALFAITLLGETLDFKTAIGIAAVIAGGVVASYSRQGLVRDWPLWAIVLPVGAAFIRASGHAVTKLGLEDVPSASFAVLVSNTVSLAIAGAAFRIEGRPISGTPKSFKWFVASGLSAAVSLHFLNSALQIGDLVSVVPVVSATPVFTMLLGLFVFRRERFSWRMLATIALVVPGVMLVAMK